MRCKKCGGYMNKEILDVRPSMKKVLYQYVCDKCGRTVESVESTEI